MSEAQFISGVYSDPHELLRLERADKARLEERVTELQEQMTAMVESSRHRQVRTFRAMTGLPSSNTPHVLPEERTRLHLRLWAEEFLEGVEACSPAMAEHMAKAIWPALAGHEINVDLPELVDALGDCDVIVEGFRAEMGVNEAPIRAEIQRSNLSKEGATMREDGKLLKGPNYSAPDIRGCLLAQGWAP